MMSLLKRIANVALRCIPNYRRLAHYRHWLDMVYLPVVEGHIGNLQKIGGSKTYLTKTLPNLIRDVYKDTEDLPNVADILLFIQAYRFHLKPPKPVSCPWQKTKQGDAKHVLKQRFDGEFARHDQHALRVLMVIVGYSDQHAIPTIIESELFYLFDRRFDVVVTEYDEDLIVFRYNDHDGMSEVRYMLLTIQDTSITMSAAQLRRFVAYLEWRREDDRIRYKERILRRYAERSA